jgi:hypothetical protein
VIEGRNDKVLRAKTYMSVWVNDHCPTVFDGSDVERADQFISARTKGSSRTHNLRRTSVMSGFH